MIFKHLKLGLFRELENESQLENKWMILFKRFVTLYIKISKTQVAILKIIIQ